MKNLTLHTFKLKYTKVVGKQGHERMKKNAEYRRTFGNMPVMQAYAQYKAMHDARMAKYDELENKIAAFEKFLNDKNARCVQSNKSESRYYYYNGKKYRFSAHVYPTGSMTNELLGIVDLCADKELINEIEKELNITL
nr:MAG TPA: hypothetical protein [Caudoviricetes sp.]